MEKNKGFTLVELIGVIVIIGVLALIAVPVYNAIQKNVLEQQYKNVVGLIETKAIKYAEEKKILIVDVDTLITDGYLDPDDEKYIYDPRNKNILNCYAVDIEFVNNSYIAKLNTEKKYENDNGCDKNALLADKSNLKIFGNEKEINSDDYWFNTSTVKLTAKLNNNNIENGNFLWTSSNGERSTEKTIEINVTKLLSATYTLRYENIENEMIYEKSVKVNVDREKPIIYEDYTLINAKDEWTKEKTISLKASDQNGSGIVGYYIGTLACNNSETQYQNSSMQQYTSISLIQNNTNYNVCVKDKAGNIGTIKPLYIDRIDTVKPLCDIVKTSNSDPTTGMNINIGCNDNESGCLATSIVQYTNAKSSKTFIIQDKAGNTNTCVATVNSITEYQGISSVYEYYQEWSSCATGSNTCQSGYVCQGGYNQSWSNCATGSNTCVGGDVCQGGYPQVWDDCASWRCPNDYAKCRHEDCGKENKTCTDCDCCGSTQTCTSRTYYWECCSSGCSRRTTSTNSNPNPNVCVADGSKCNKYSTSCKTCTKACCGKRNKECRTAACGPALGCKVANRICTGGYVQGSYNECLTTKYDSCKTGENTCVGGYVQGSYNSCLTTAYSSCATGSNTCAGGNVTKSRFSHYNYSAWNRTNICGSYEGCNTRTVYE